MGGKMKGSGGGLFGTFWAESAESEKSFEELASLREKLDLTASWNKLTAAEKKAWLQANGLS